MEGNHPVSYMDTATPPQRTVGNGFNMDQVGAKQQWNKAFADFDGIKPNFDDVYYKGVAMEKEQISQLYKHVAKIKEDQLISKLNKGAPDTWSKLKPNERLALESANYNSPQLVGKNLTKYIQDYTKIGNADDLAKAVKELQTNGGKGYPASNKQLQPRRDGEAALLAGGK